MAKANPFIYESSNDTAVHSYIVVLSLSVPINGISMKAFFFFSFFFFCFLESIFKKETLKLVSKYSPTDQYRHLN